MLTAELQLGVDGGGGDALQLGLDGGGGRCSPVRDGWWRSKMPSSWGWTVAEADDLQLKVEEVHVLYLEGDGDKRITN